MEEAQLRRGEAGGVGGKINFGGHGCNTINCDVKECLL